MPERKISVRIVAENSAAGGIKQLETDLGKAGKKADEANSRLAALGQRMSGLGKSAANLGNQLGNLGNKLTLAVTLPLIGAGVAVTKLAMDAEESENLFTVSMGDMADSARKFSEQMRDQLGLNSYEIRKQVGTWNVMLTAMGLGKQAALDMSEGLTQLAYDMASFYNLRPEEAFNKLRSGIVGETEPLRALGIVITDTAVQSWALSAGLIKSGQEMSAAQKTAGRYQMILEQTSAAQGDLARTIDSPANQLRVFKDRLTEVGIEAGQVFLPMVSAALMWVNNTGLPAVRRGLDDFKTSWTEMSDHAKVKMLLIAGLFLGSGPLLKAVSVSIQGLGLLASAFGLLPKSAAIGVTGAGVILIAFRDQMADIGEAVGNFMHDMGVGMVQAGGLAAKLGQPLINLGNHWYNIAQDLRGKGLGGMIFDELVDVGNAAFDALADKAMGLTADLAGPAETAAERRIKRQLDYGEQYADLYGGVVVPKVKLTADEFAKLADNTDAAAKAGDKATDAAKNLGPAISEIVDAYVRLNPATVAATAAVTAWQARIESVNVAIQANADQLQAAQAEYSRMGDRLSELNSQLNTAKQRLSDLSNPRLLGMGALDDQLFALSQSAKKLELLKLQGKAPAGVDKMLEDLQKKQDILRLQGELKYDDPLRKLRAAAEGPIKEMSFAEAMAGITQTRAEIANLTGQVAATEAAMRAHQSVISGIQAAGDALNRTLKDYQVELAGAQAKQALVNSTLQTAYQWLLVDRYKFTELGAEGERIARVMDAKAYELLASVDKMADDTSTISAETLATMVANYQTSMALALTEVGKLQTALDENHIPRYIETIHVTRHYDLSGDEPLQRRQFGGSAFAGQSYIVGEAGPEVFSPRVSGAIVPIGRGTSAGDVYNINLNVAGSVTSEGRLIDNIHAGLLRKQKSNGGRLGIA